MMVSLHTLLLVQYRSTTLSLWFTSIGCLRVLAGARDFSIRTANFTGRDNITVHNYPPIAETDNGLLHAQSHVVSICSPFG